MKGDITVNMTLKAGGVVLNVPVIPPKVTLSFGNSKPKTIDIFGKGSVDFPNGKDLDSISWSCFFPAVYDPFYCSTQNLKSVEWYKETLNSWKDNGTVVQVIIPAMGVNGKFRIKTFQGDHRGQKLDFYYDIEFKEYVKLPQVKVEAKKYIQVKKRDPKPVKPPEKPNGGKKEKIKKGDKVQFNGGPVYISSMASKATVNRKKAKCNCTIVNSNAHPYHLISYSGDKVYGWVNASDCEKL